MNGRFDIVIPLSNESVDGKNDELRLFLRSLEENGRGVGRVLLATEEEPWWFVMAGGDDVIHVRDEYRHNKDANLFEKVRAALKVSKAEEVVFTADDCAILRPLDLGRLPLVYNEKTVEGFQGGGTWRKRMRATLAETGLKGGNYDAHCPVRWPREAALRAMVPETWREPEGRTIGTLIGARIWGRTIPAGAVAQRQVKVTAESEEDALKVRLDGGEWFVGYNDRGFRGGMRERLFERFPKKSRWEK